MKVPVVRSRKKYGVGFATGFARVPYRKAKESCNYRARVAPFPSIRKKIFDTARGEMAC
jgi:hypothetical protein